MAGVSNAEIGIGKFKAKLKFPGCSGVEFQTKKHFVEGVLLI